MGPEEKQKYEGKRCEVRSGEKGMGMDSLLPDVSGVSKVMRLGMTNQEQEKLDPSPKSSG